MFRYHGHILRYVDIVKKAEGFLKNFRSDSKIPIPIEEIAETDLGVYIVPETGLWSEYEIAGWSSLDQSTIYIDTDIYMKHEQWARFTIAHEIGHFQLHHSLIPADEIKNREDWKRLVLEQQDDEVDFEWQADAFAGCILMPTSHLVSEVEDNLKKAKPLFERNGLSWDENTAIENMAPAIARIFNVSQPAASTRLSHWQSKQRGVPSG